MIKIHDCSNSSARPIHRGGGGPVINDVMRYLHEHAQHWGYEFVSGPKEAQAIITNDVFPTSVLRLGVPLVKRMCAPFWQTEYQSRNIVLNMAASQADQVIFISEYSKTAYLNDPKRLPIRRSRVVRNWIDPKEFSDTSPRHNKTFTLAACATDWSRPEKRLPDLIDFAYRNRDTKFLVIGTVSQNLPDNCTKVGYLSSSKDMADVFNKADGFINLSYRDAAPKVVAQAVNCGLPVLYGDSGGTKEMAGNYGVPITDNPNAQVSYCVPPLNHFDISEGYAYYRREFPKIKRRLKRFNRGKAFEDMLYGYFNAIGEIIK